MSNSIKQKNSLQKSQHNKLLYILIEIKLTALHNNSPWLPKGSHENTTTSGALTHEKYFHIGE